MSGRSPMRSTNEPTSGATVMIISSDVESLMRFTPRMGMLYRGELIYDGDTRAMVDSKNAVVRQFVRGLTEGPL